MSAASARLTAIIAHHRLIACYTCEITLHAVLPPILCFVYCAVRFLSRKVGDLSAAVMCMAVQVTRLSW
jgi:hypothetical protein